VLVLFHHLLHHHLLLLLLQLLLSRHRIEEIARHSLLLHALARILLLDFGARTLRPLEKNPLFFLIIARVLK
jgi:hypothetical protein